MVYAHRKKSEQKTLFENAVFYMVFAHFKKVKTHFCNETLLFYSDFSPQRKVIFFTCSETLCFYMVFEPLKKVLFFVFFWVSRRPPKQQKMQMKISRKTGYLTENASQTAIVAGLLV